MAQRSINARDAGLALISRINRWLIAAAVAMAGFVSLAAAKTFHGHTTHSTGATSRSTGSSSTPSGNTGSSSSGNTGSGSSGNTGSGGNTGNTGNTGSGLQQPSSAPTPAPASSGPVVSGGS